MNEDDEIYNESYYERLGIELEEEHDHSNLFTIDMNICNVASITSGVSDNEILTTDSRYDGIMSMYEIETDHPRILMLEQKIEELERKLKELEEIKYNINR